MRARSLKNASGTALLFALPFAGCASEPLYAGGAGDGCDFGRERQAFTLKCLERSLDPVTDPESPDFGRVNCSIIELGSAESDFCDCALPGYAPASGDEVNNAYAEVEASGGCHDACCDDICFCKLLQLSGDELLACQGGDNARETVDRSGWCYVEPDLGVGEPSSVDGCPADARHRLLFTPIRSTHYDIVSCVTTPS